MSFMPVIPFNPGSGNGAPTMRDRPRSGEQPVRRATATGDGAAVDTAAPSRAVRLEHALIAALRECAVNWARAERAERTVAEREPPGNRG